MHHDAGTGGMLWPALLLIAVAAVVADFIHHPFLGAPVGDAAPPSHAVTLWVARLEAEGPSAAVVRLAAGSLGTGATATVGELPGGSAAALERFAAHRPTRGADLFTVTSTTLADLARDRHDTLLPDARQRAAHAKALLAGMMPIALLSRDPLRLAVGVDARFGEQTLMRDLAHAPAARIFGIPGDAWIEAQFAALVQGAATLGRVPYGAYHSAEDALLALPAGDADVALVPASAASVGRRDRTLRTLSWPRAAGPAPSAWVALVARAGTPKSQLHELRRKLRALARSERWRVLLSRTGRRVPVHLPSLGRLRRFLDQQAQAAERLQVLAARLHRR